MNGWIAGAACAIALATMACDGESGRDAGPSATDAGADAGLDAGPPFDAGPPDAGEPICDLSAWDPATVSLEAAVIAELNARRGMVQTCGTEDFGPSGAVVLDEDLTEAARCHALDMLEQGTPSATGSDGASFLERAERAGYDGQAFASVPGWTVMRTAASMVDAALTNDSSCPRMLDPTASDVGVGVTPESLDDERAYFEIVVGR